jgi:hypothetical protein
MQAYERLIAENIKTRVVSLPAWTAFDHQDQSYRGKVLAPAVTARVAVEEASPIGLERYTGPNGIMLGMRTFGLSAPMKSLPNTLALPPNTSYPQRNKHWLVRSKACWKVRFLRRVENATWNDWTRSDGVEHGAAAA